MEGLLRHRYLVDNGTHGDLGCRGKACVYEVPRSSAHDAVKVKVPFQPDWLREAFCEIGSG